MTGIDHDHPPIDAAARWLAEYGPGQKALNECKSRFGLSASRLPDICLAASKIRSEAYERGADHG